MFSFHKPKIYRSNSGCCICKAKSSSSRFTDSKKYEVEFEKCFRICEKRSGEICNACVLLVKRWKKLPAGTTRDWHHVVDARAGPGTKSAKGKITSTNNNSSTTSSSNHHTSHTNKKQLKPKNLSQRMLEEMMDDDMNEYSIVTHNASPIATVSDSSDLDEDGDMDDNDNDLMEEDMSLIDDEFDEEVESKTNCNANIKIDHKKSSNSSSNHSPNSSNYSKRNKNMRDHDKDNVTVNKISSFLDMSFWRKEKVCCGIIFKGPDNELLICPKLYKPCGQRNILNNNTLLMKEKSLNAENALTLTCSDLTSPKENSDGGSIMSSIIEDDTSSNSSSGNISLI